MLGPNGPKGALGLLALLLNLGTAGTQDRGKSIGLYVWGSLPYLGKYSYLILRRRRRRRRSTTATHARARRRACSLRKRAPSDRRQSLQLHRPRSAMHRASPRVLTATASHVVHRWRSVAPLQRSFAAVAITPVEGFAEVASSAETTVRDGSKDKPDEEWQKMVEVRISSPPPHLCHSVSCTPLASFHSPANRPVPAVAAACAAGW